MALRAGPAPAAVAERGSDDSLTARVLGPFQWFFSTSAAGGIVLLLASAVAVAWANSPWAPAYQHLWETPVTVGAPGFGLTMSLHRWVNDGLMTVFFVLVGLEVKREFLVGELASRRTAMLPLAAAVGGMLLPALIYVGVNRGGAGLSGWAVPMATDIAFALGVLGLLGDGAPRGLRVFVAALAIADDLGAVIVIAFFYGAPVDWGALRAVLLVLATLIALNRLGVRHPLVYGLGGLVLWEAMLTSGVHATIAGVLLALCIPAGVKAGGPEFIARAEAGIDAFRVADASGGSVLSSSGLQTALFEIERAAEAAQSPLLRMERALHAPVAFGIMPLFALANAGVTFDGDSLGALADPVAVGVVVGLLLGKPIGIMLATYLVVRTDAAELPSGVSWGQLHGAAWLAGIGFTMSIFIGSLAFPDPDRLDIAKRAIMVASILAGTVGSLLMRRARTVRG